MLELNHRFDFRGQSVAWGKMGEGNPLVLIHGTPFSSQVWRRIAPLLAGRWQVFYFDLIGYGQSEKQDDQDVSLGVQNQLLSELVYEWNIRTPEILAHDFGGTTALRAYYLDGLRYEKLTLIEPVAIAPWGSSFVQHVRAHEAVFSELPAYAHEALLRAYLQSSSHQKLSDKTLDIYVEPWLGKIGQSAFYRQIAQMDQRFTDEIEAQYTTMECPVQLLWGQEDEWIPISRGQKLAQKITSGKLQTISNSGHLMQEDRPEAIIAAMLQ